MTHDFTTYKSGDAVCVECGHLEAYPDHTPSVHIIKPPPPHPFTKRPSDLSLAAITAGMPPLLCAICGRVLEDDIHEIRLNLNPQSREEFTRQREAQQAETATAFNFGNVLPHEKAFWVASFVAALGSATAPKQGRDEQRTAVGVATRCANLALERYRQQWDQPAAPQPTSIHHDFCPQSAEPLICAFCDRQEGDELHYMGDNPHAYKTEQPTDVLCTTCGKPESDGIHRSYSPPQSLTVEFTPLPPYQVPNEFMVALQGDRIVIFNRHKLGVALTFEKAVNLAAWLVAIAEPYAPRTFAESLTAVQEGR